MKIPLLYIIGISAFAVGFLRLMDAAIGVSLLPWWAYAIEAVVGVALIFIGSAQMGRVHR